MVNTVQPFIPQGWQCPVCKRVYSPTTPMCYFCPEKTVTVTTTAESGKPPSKPQVSTAYINGVDC